MMDHPDNYTVFGIEKPFPWVGLGVGLARRPGANRRAFVGVRHRQCGARREDPRRPTRLLKLERTLPWF
ncbi:hypothetical protein VC74_gp24 [Mycobacterium phage Sparky]|uniref:Uncharacterized protein n=1 Tax=Mycobacterium phage Sparky TaxID=1527493 RepID=A0A076G787_9CAUD|nr:hypothetical protein VC74_gp24 [Mycobacterium phage Sparky]AII28172.1 hypothetical protein PBI_SPARKY_24 [Mycobacterium phage Sparky]